MKKVVIDFFTAHPCIVKDMLSVIRSRIPGKYIVVDIYLNNILFHKQKP